MTRQRTALVAYFVALYAIHAIVGWWTPLQGDDWNHIIWAGQHETDSSGAWLARFLGNHVASSDAIGYLLTHCRLIHALVSPLAMIALVVGVFVLAMRRLPRATWDDLLVLALVNAAIWIAQPVAGSSLLHRPNVAAYVYGGAAAAWFLVPLRCGWRVTARWVPLLVLAGYVAGTSTRALGLATFAGALLLIRAMPRAERSRSMWIAFAGLAIGTIVGYVNPPWIELGRIYRRGLDPNLVVVKLPIFEAGELVSLVAALVLVDLALGMFGRERAPADARPDPTDTLRWFVAWFLTTIWCLFGPKYNEATVLPATCMIVVAAIPYFVWLARSRPLRLLIIAITIAIHAIIWITIVVKYERFGAEGAARMAAIESAPKGSVVTIRPYSQVAPSFWFLGEDLGTARQRQLLAIESFGLKDITFEPMFRRLEPNPGVSIHLEIEGITQEQLQAVHAPAIWATEPSAARKQFELLVRRLRSKFGKQFSARLVVDDIVLPGRADRPLLAWADSTVTVIPRIARSNLDENSNYTIRIYGRDAHQFDEAWIVAAEATQTPYRGGAPRLQAKTATPSAIIVCNKDRCLLADSFVPRF